MLGPDFVGQFEGVNPVCIPTVIVQCGAMFQSLWGAGAPGGVGGSHGSRMWSYASIAAVSVARGLSAISRMSSAMYLSCCILAAGCVVVFAYLPIIIWMEGTACTRELRHLKLVKYELVEVKLVLSGFLVAFGSIE